MRYKQCAECPLSLVCASIDLSYVAYCSSLKKFYMCDPKGPTDRSVFVVPQWCPAIAHVEKRKCAGDHGNDGRSMCNKCAVAMVVLGEVLKEKNAKDRSKKELAEEQATQENAKRAKKA